ncbi:MAG: Fe-S cluster assembly protein SufB, partial [Rectinema sp.]
MVSDSDIRNIGSGYAERFGFAMPERSILKTQTGLTEETVREISKAKDEPDWMLQFRLNAFHIYEKKPLPTWGADLSKLDFEGMTYYSKPTEKPQTSWEALPAEIKNTYERLGVPEAERSYLAGVGAQYDSEMVYHNIREDLKKKGIIFADIETAEHEYPELLKRYFATVVPPSDNKFAALNSAVWSGGSFIYVPPHVHVDIP